MAAAQTDPLRQAYHALFDAAAPLPELTTAYQVENATSMLLGGVYPYAVNGDRRGLMIEFVDKFVKYLARRRTVQAQAVLAGLAAVAPGAGAERAARAAQRFADRDVAGPRWVGETGKVCCTGAWRADDQHGDQTHYMITFAYQKPEVGGPEHAACALLDHNRGLAAEIVVAAPAAGVVDGWRQTAAQAGGAITLAEIEPALARAQVEQRLIPTEQLPEHPGGQQYLDHWALLVARLATVTDTGGGGAPSPLAPVAREAIVRAFLGSPEGQRAASGAGAREPVAAGARLAVDYAVDANSGDPLRWSPTAVTLFLTEWLPTQPDLPDSLGPVAFWLPEVLDAFVAYAGQAKDAPAASVAATRRAVAQLSRLDASTATGGEAAESLDAEPVDQVLRQMVADGVDPEDEEAARRWLTAYLEREKEQNEKELRG